ncbi:MAG: hypothetical protein OXJ90_08075 [Spirochaetaceae bacterium]|nr:hypothetical protein [Spirochaetaceae bacterium]
MAGLIREALLRVFATTYSPSVQDSLYRKGEEALAAASDICEITLRTPNVHFLPIDLSPFGQDARGKVFLPTDEPSGRIEVTLERVCWVPSPRTCWTRRRADREPGSAWSSST